MPATMPPMLCFRATLPMPAAAAAFEIAMS